MRLSLKKLLSLLFLLLALPSLAQTPSNAQILAQLGGNYRRTAAEINAGVTPVNYAYPVGNVLRYGADPTGATSSTTAFTNCLASLAPLGGTCTAYGGNYKLSTSLTMVASTTLECGKSLPDNPAGTNYPVLLSQQNSIALSTSATINMAPNSYVKGCYIFPSGMTFPQSGSGSWAGTAITIATGNGGAGLENDLIIGFATDVSATGDRVRITNTNLDGNACISANNSFDTSVYHNIHCWPFATVGFNSGSPSAAALSRSGYGFTTLGESDDTDIDNVLVFAHSRNFEFNSNGNLKIGRLWSDDATANNTSGTYGVYFDGSVSNVEIDTIMAFSSTYPIYALQGTGNVSINKALVDSPGANGFACLAGGVTHINNLEVFGANVATPVIFSGSGTCIIDAGHLWGSTSAPANNTIYISLSSGRNLTNTKVNTDRIITDLPAGASLFGTNILAVPTVASAGTLQLPSTMTDFWSVSGTTGITAMQSTWGGHEITLLFQGSLTVTNGGNLALTGAANFSTSAGSMIRFIYDSNAATWREEWRH